MEKSVKMLYLWGNKGGKGEKREEKKGEEKNREETHAPTAARAAGT